MTHSNYTGRAPRTLQESSFGPYARWDVQRPSSFLSRFGWLIALVLFLIVTGCAAVAPFLGG